MSIRLSLLSCDFFYKALIRLSDWRCLPSGGQRLEISSSLRSPIQVRAPRDFIGNEAPQLFRSCDNGLAVAGHLRRCHHEVNVVGVIAEPVPLSKSIL